MKLLLDHREKPTWCRVLILAAVVLAATVSPAFPQQGPGVRGGISADPDQFFIGGHFVTRPVWDRLRFQPNVEAGFGDDRTVVAFNMEFGYWMPVKNDWHVYVGGGPAVNVTSTDGKGGDDAGPGLNIFAGLQRHGGLFFEIKVGAFDSPDFKLTIGYTFR